MNRHAWYFTLIILIAAMLILPGDILAKERRRGGGGAKLSSINRGGFQRGGALGAGGKLAQGLQTRGSLAGQRRSAGTWNRQARTGDAAGQFQMADGRTASGNIHVSQTGNAHSAQASLRGPEGNTADISRTKTQNHDGSYTVSSTVTGTQGNTASAERTTGKTDAGRETSRQFSTSTGQSGAHTSSVDLQNKTLQSSTSLSGAQGSVQSATSAAKGRGIATTQSLATPEGTIQSATTASRGNVNTSQTVSTAEGTLTNDASYNKGVITSHQTITDSTYGLTASRDGSLVKEGSNLVHNETYSAYGQAETYTETIPVVPVRSGLPAVPVIPAEAQETSER